MTPHFTHLDSLSLFDMVLQISDISCNSFFNPGKGFLVLVG